ncbi:MAG: U32 family peptidase [Chloroflexi bacterium]|nr:U32 family peptidase [Chloroflexota bacterium]
MTEQNRIQKPEVLSPVGYWPQLEAAIEAGADAVYFGLKHFTARAKVGFTLTELPDVMRTLHQRDVKGYVTFNTLVFDHELREAAKTLGAIAEAGADAIIVQDVAVSQLAQRIAPALDVHGSTQMSITSAEGVRLAQRLGARRVVLARELSLDDVREIRAHTDCELEIFVHGALCVSYSGQCFSSEAWGGRSANRGQCAQACRLPYEMIVDDQPQPLADARYLLSPGDLYTVQQIPEIVQIGISTLKIEGRYKDARYVALTTQAYRKAVDEAWAGLPLSITRGEEMQLEQVYSRGLGPYFVTGTNHQMVVKGRSPGHRGVQMGRVVRVLPESVIVEPAPGTEAAPLKAGDGVVFDAADWRSPELHEEGGRIYQIVPVRGGQLELHFGHGALDTRRIRSGDLVWRTNDPDIDKAVRPFTQANAPVHKQPLRVHVTAHEGQPLRTVWTLVERPSLEAIVQSEEPLGAAQNRAISADYLREQLGRLGNTPYELADLQLDVTGHPFVPSSLLNHLRREAVERLVALQSQPSTITVHDPIATLEAALAEVDRDAPTLEPTEPQLHLLVRTPEQLEAALEVKPASITLDYLELYGLRPAVEQVQARGITARVASPRVLKPSEQRVVRFLLKLDCEILVRSTGLLDALQDETHHPLIGDFSLNAANVLSADTFLRLGLTRFTPTHDLNAAQIAELARQIGPEKLEAVAYHHLPVFHTEHCVFCRFLSKGTSFKDCGHPCEKHRVSLQDINGRAHPVMADVGCRNTVFGAEAQEASRFLDRWQDSGIRHFRLEFVHETAEQVAQVARAFAVTLSGHQSTHDLSQQLQRSAPQGTTQGSLFVPDTYLMLPVLQ